MTATAYQSSTMVDAGLLVSPCLILPNTSAESFIASCKAETQAHQEHKLAKTHDKNRLSFIAHSQLYLASGIQQLAYLFALIIDSNLLINTLSRYKAPKLASLHMDHRAVGISAGNGLMKVHARSNITHSPPCPPFDFPSSSP